MEKGEIKNKAFKGKIENKEETETAIVTVRPLAYRGKNYPIGAEMVVDVDTLVDLVKRNRVKRKNDGE